MEFKEAHTVGFCVLQGAGVVPLILIDVIRSDDGAGAVGTSEAVHKNGAGCVVFENASILAISVLVDGVSPVIGIFKYVMRYR